MSEVPKTTVFRAVQALQQRVSAAHVIGQTRDDGELARDFNALLQQAKEHYPQSDGLRLIEPLRPDASVAGVAVRLVMMRRTIETECDDVHAIAHPAEERRRWERSDVEWPARVVMGQGSAVAAKAIDASLHGLRIVLEGSAAEGLANGQRCGVEVQLADNSARFFREAEVRHIASRGVGLEIPEALPAVLVQVQGAAEGPVATGKPSRGPLRSLLVALRLRSA